MIPPNNDKTTSLSSTMLGDTYAHFSRMLDQYNKLLEHLENKAFAELSRPVFEEHIKILKTAEDTFAMLFNDSERLLMAQPKNTANWIKVKENRNYAATVLEELQSVRRRLVAVMDGVRTTRLPSRN